MLVIFYAKKDEADFASDCTTMVSQNFLTTMAAMIAKTFGVYDTSKECLLEDFY